MTTANTLAVADMRAAVVAYRHRRIRLNLSQEKVAELTGLSRRAIAEYENGSIFPASPKLAKLLRAVGLRLTAAEVEQP